MRPRSCRNDPTDARIYLNDVSEIFDVDPELHRRRAHDGRVLASRELLFRERPVSPAHRAVVNEHLEAAPGQRVPDLLGLRSTLDEDETLLSTRKLADTHRGLTDIRTAGRRRRTGVDSDRLPADLLRLAGALDTSHHAKEFEFSSTPIRRNVGRRPAQRACPRGDGSRSRNDHR
jgi:hypothetical protein